MFVNYIAEMNAFFAWTLEAEPSANAQLLWHALMNAANARGDGSDWPESFSLSNRSLLLRLPYSEDTLARAREELIRLGRIRFTPGSKIRRPCYALLLFADGEQNDPQESTVPAEPYHTKPQTYTHTADEEQSDSELRTSARETLAEIGEETPREQALDRFVRAAERFGANAPLVREAIRQAAENNAGHALRYAEALLEGWSEAGYRTPEDVLDAQILRRRESWRASAPMDEPLPEGWGMA